MSEPDDEVNGYPPDPGLPPGDVVPRRGLTVEFLSQLNDAAGTIITYGEPGAVVLDPDGLPVGVGPSSSRHGVLARPMIDWRDLESLGVTLAEAERRWPKLRFINPEGTSTEGTAQ